MVAQKPPLRENSRTGGTPELQVLIRDSDYAFIHELRAAAWYRGLPLGDYVRSIIVKAGREEPTAHIFSGDEDHKGDRCSPSV